MNHQSTNYTLIDCRGLELEWSCGHIVADTDFLNKMATPDHYDIALLSSIVQRGVSSFPNLWLEGCLACEAERCFQFPEPSARAAHVVLP